ncbi:TlpA disulfide reductase family protein [Neolewinella litorea]|uniref:AhpC/TSA family protein n=1 Tax=Neolewinella litorea TaxID=2562452 RepID=A0A4S4NMS1_9BACT|nr:TlpA disulfide reductase family protein [Neolewinella litorea]THH40247.1 AhpC/TSA family protein [Neolewinella litorea]
MRAPIFISLLALPITSCISTEGEEYTNKSFYINGEVSGSYSDWIYLFYEDVKDSIRVKDGQFFFTGKLDHPVQASIVLAGTSTLTRIYLDGGDKVEVTADYQLQGEEPSTVNTLQNVIISGSASQNLYTSMRTRYIELSKADSTGQQVYELMAHLIDSTGSHPAVGTQLASAAISPDGLTAAHLDSLYTRFDTTRMDAQAKQVYAVGMANRIRYTIGDTFPDIPIQRPDGTPAYLSELRGLHVYVDFWASWCTPCRQQHPRLWEIADKIANSSLAIVSISIDQDREKWLRASEEDNVSWSSYWDAEHRLEEDMIIKAIPKSYVLNEYGIIVAIDPEIEDYHGWTGL